MVNKNCPFCGGPPDITGVLHGDGTRSPECESCGATARSLAAWNTRVENGLEVLEKLVALWDKNDVWAGDVFGSKPSGSPNHGHSMAMFWDGDASHYKGQPCDECRLYEEARALVNYHKAAPATPGPLEPSSVRCEYHGADLETADTAPGTDDEKSTDPNGCRGIAGLEHRWAKSFHSDNTFCTKCGVMQGTEYKLPWPVNGQQMSFDTVEKKLKLLEVGLVEQADNAECKVYDRTDPARIVCGAPLNQWPIVDLADGSKAYAVLRNKLSTDPSHHNEFEDDEKKA